MSVEFLPTAAQLFETKSHLKGLQLSCHITPILRSLHWLRITERIEYKLLSLTYKVLTTTQAQYLHNLISVQRPRSTRSSSVVTLAWPPSSSSLKWLITPSVILHLVSGISSLRLFVNLILVQFFHFLLTYSFTHHFFLFWFTTLYSSISLSLAA